MEPDLEARDAARLSGGADCRNAPRLREREAGDVPLGERSPSAARARRASFAERLSAALDERDLHKATLVPCAANSPDETCAQERTLDAPVRAPADSHDGTSNAIGEGARVLAPESRAADAIARCVRTRRRAGGGEQVVVRADERTLGALGVRITRAGERRVDLHVSTTSGDAHTLDVGALVSALARRGIAVVELEVE